MHDIIGYAITGVITFAIGYVLKFIEPKSRLLWWSAHEFLFTLTPPDNTSNTSTFFLHTHAFTIQNGGRKTAENIEIAHLKKPDHFKLHPSLDFVPSETPTGEHIIRVASLAPKEFFTIEFLSYTAIPQLLYIRSKDVGHATRINVQPQQTLPSWYLLLGRLLISVGIIVTIYALVKLTLFIFGIL